MGEAPTHSFTVLVNDHYKWEVDKILDNKVQYHKKHYLVKWKGFSIEELIWKSEENLENAQEVFKNYLQKKQSYSKTNKSIYNRDKPAKDRHDSEVAGTSSTTTDSIVMKVDLTDKESQEEQIISTILQKPEKTTSARRLIKDYKLGLLDEEAQTDCLW
ncbi:hypothetical protein CIHG_10055 [Coccidioides immitis H538.4]|uniref:Chromo domain-containing protein n=1 Tax=Coccidioides immitis H538.4 TaxID=396776 RepID=A0A0J8UWF5_COCIT|nr:hypothetical protein CIHG_10055 [Coccidioides immitis H538.4]